MTGPGHRDRAMRHADRFAAIAVAAALLAGVGLGAVTLGAGQAAAMNAEPPLRLAEADADPIVLKALEDIAHYEALADQMAPGDKKSGRAYMKELGAIGNQLGGVRDKAHPKWREAAERFNAVQDRVVAIANQKAAAVPAPEPATAAPAADEPAPPARQEPPRLISSDQAKLNRVSTSIRSLGQQVDTADINRFFDAQGVADLRGAVASYREQLGGFPAEIPDVMAARHALDEIEKRLEARIADAASRLEGVGDVEAVLGEIEQRLQATQVPQSQAFDPATGPDAGAAFAKTLVDLRTQSEADTATLAKIAATGLKDQRLERLTFWAGAERQRQIDESRNAAIQSMEAHIARYLEVAAFQAATDPNDPDHVANRLLGEDQPAKTLAEFDAGLAALATAEAFDVALGRSDAPDRAAQKSTIAEARAGFEEKHRIALAGSRMPPAGMTDDALIGIATDVLANPDYEGIQPHRRLVINSRSVQREEKKEAEFTSDTVKTTATIYHWVWDEFQVASAEPVGDKFYIFYNTLKFFHEGAPTTPLNRWVLSGRFKGQQILEANIDK